MLSDTHPQIEAMHLAMLRQVPPWRKADMLGQMYQTAKQLTQIGLRHRYPDASDSELRYRLAVIYHGPELAKRIWGTLTEAEFADAN
ncbi:MAG: hypothetical protein H8E28_16130 [Anaerolineae bacterium]|nr:hypothetical protein [Anaerolineae bacterium]